MDVSHSYDTWSYVRGRLAPPLTTDSAERLRHRVETHVQNIASDDDRESVRERLNFDAQSHDSSETDSMLTQRILGSERRSERAHARHDGRQDSHGLSLNNFRS